MKSVITKEQRYRLRELTQKARNREDVLVPSRQLIGLLDQQDQLERNMADMILWANAMVEGIKKHMPSNVTSGLDPSECSGCGQKVWLPGIACTPDCVWTLIDNIGKAPENDSLD